MNGMKGFWMRHLLIVGLALGASVGAVRAQDAPIPVTYQHEKTLHAVPINAAIDAALATPDFVRRQTPDSGTMVLTTPDGWRYTEPRKKDHVQFRLVFARDGDKIGESEEICTVHAPYDCVEQIAADIKSAAAIAR